MASVTATPGPRDGAGAASRVVTVAATNHPWELDKAFLRRFQKRVYLSLPDQSARAELFRLKLSACRHTLSDGDFDDLGASSEGYSGSDITAVCIDAALEPIRELQDTITWSVCSAAASAEGRGAVSPDSQMATPAAGLQLRADEFLEPCGRDDNPSPGGAIVHGSLWELPRDRIFPRALSKQGVLDALRRNQPTVTEDDLARHEQFTHAFGLRGP